MKTSSRRERELLQRRDEIFDAVLRLLAKNGIQGVTMNKIATEAEFSVGTLYNLFGSKETLYEQLAENKLAEFHSQMTGALEAPGGEVEKIRAWLSEKIRLFGEHKEQITLFFAETMAQEFGIKTGFKSEIIRVRKDVLDRVTTVFRSGIEKGIFIDKDPYSMTIALDGIANAMIFESFEDKVNVSTDIILELFFGSVLKVE